MSYLSLLNLLTNNKRLPTELLVNNNDFHLCLSLTLVKNSFDRFAVGLKALLICCVSRNVNAHFQCTVNRYK